jgi:Uma2 family endonuclease
MTRSLPPPSARLRELIDDRTSLMPLSVEQYHGMIDAGFLPEGEPYELLSGYLVRKDRSAAGEEPMTVGHEHILTVNKLAKLSRRVEKFGCFLQTQQPISLPPFDEPEPDGSIIRGKMEDYAGRVAGASDVLCVIEVADSSLQRDRTTKLQVYAANRLPKYLLINLTDRVVEDYTLPLAGKGGTPRYRRRVILSGRDKVELPLPNGKCVAVTARSLLP